MSQYVYLAGPICGLSWDQATDWRDYAIKILGGILNDGLLQDTGIVGVSPLRGKDFLRDNPEIKSHYDERAISSARGITTRDRDDVRRCDLVLANFLGSDPKRLSIGTTIELAWADAFGTPSILCAEPDHPLVLHPMSSQIAGYVVHDLDEAINLARAMLGVYA